MNICSQCAAQGSGGFIRRSGNMVLIRTPVEPCGAAADITVDADGKMTMHPRAAAQGNERMIGVEQWIG